MGPKPTPSKQSNTLFSYFMKSPPPTKTGPTKNQTQEVLSPKKSPNQKTGSGANASPFSKSKNIETEHKLFDVVWTKLEGYPWWPSLICNHPTENKYYRGGKSPQIHVQFFDEPPSRAWIKTKNVRPYKGSDDKEFQRGGPYFTLNVEVKKGAKAADEALKINTDERQKLIVELQPSDDEDNEEDNGMDDLDPDIFDDEMDDEEADNSKENQSMETDHEQKEQPKQTPSKSKSPRKTPKKDTLRKSARKPQAKRRRIVEDQSDDDSEDEFKLKSDHESSSEDESSGVDENEESEPENETDPETPVKENRKRKRPAPKSENKKIKAKISEFSSDVRSTGSSFTPTVGTKTKSKLALFTASESAPSTSGNTEQEANFPHLKLDFLQPHKIRDADGHPKSHPDYDPRTVFLPENYKKNLTPALRQWWEMKARHFDTILFFKMGKFYELFHMDAVIGVNELGIIYMKGEHAHSGFPEIAYDRYANTLIQKGYKVARIEQTETPDMMAERIKNMSKAPTKFDKVVKREICRITGRGTQSFNFTDGDCSETQSSYLLAIAEKEEDMEGRSVYGVCFVDTTIGKFHVGQFVDDRHCSRLRTLMAHYTPSQILFEKHKMSQKTTQVLNSNLTSVLKEGLRSGTEFWESSKTLKSLNEEDYFKQDDEIKWPPALKKMTSDSDSLGLTAKDEYSLAISALGAVIWYLQYSLLDQELLSMNSFEEYCPLDTETSVSESKSSVFSSRQHMILDGVTLQNLDITENSSTGTLEGTLLERLDQCSTPFGRRLFRQWVCAPLCNPDSINDRLDAVEDLIGSQDVVAEVIDLMKKLPDLERILGRIHSLGSASRCKHHPDSRAIFFDEAKYSKKKIEDFLSTLDGFKTTFKIGKKFKDHVGNYRSKFLKKTLTLDSVDEAEGRFPDLRDDIQFFENAFDHNKAKKDGVIVPSKGVNPAYDRAMTDIQIVERKLDDYLEKQRTRIGCRSIVYWGNGKNRFQMEIPEASSKNIPNEYELFSSKKGWKRYRTKDIEKLLAELVDAEDRKDTALKDTMRRIFECFDERYKTWNTAVQCLSVLDVLISFSQYSRCGDGPVCRPDVISPGPDTEPFIEIRDARHPCICRTFTGSDFIPNDTVVGIRDENEMETESEDHSNSKIVLVTGPNMGGKSTLMRQVGLVVIISQLGCYVPAEKCRLTPVDRVFTRLGASDRIMAGESTFFVELSETSAILQHATKHSLVLMDELGRGTATYDGTAIACSVVNELSQSIGCRTLFSTHYHSLVEEFSHDPNIRLGHMACMVENDDEEDPTQETITFLYKFTKGACPKSYGFNAARLADIPDDVIKVAIKKSKEFEEVIERQRNIRSLWKAEKCEELQHVQLQIRVS